jgi:AcrR family transcriptional regulator
MGITERKQREREERKYKIREAAIELFLNEGVEHVTIRRIAEKIEYAPATIYLYFKDKMDILMDIHREGFNILISYLQRVKEDPDIIMQMKKSTAAYVDFAIENPEYYKLIFIVSYKQKGLDSPDKWEEGRTAYDGLRTNIKKCVELGIITSPDVEEIAFAVWSFIHGLSSLLVSQNGPVKIEDKKAFAAKAINFFYNNLNK